MADTLSEAVEVLERSQSAFGERRRRARWSVHWPVRFLGGGEAGDATTLNLSSAGFYCHTRASFTAGETLMCMVLLPGRQSPGRVGLSALQCKARVLRVEPARLEGVADVAGVAFRILEYRVV